MVLLLFLSRLLLLPDLGRIDCAVRGVGIIRPRNTPVEPGLRQVGKSRSDPLVDTNKEHPENNPVELALVFHHPSHLPVVGKRPLEEFVGTGGALLREGVVETLL